MVSMDEDPEKYRQAVWRDGPASVHRLLDRLEEIAAEYGRWAPALRAFATECRQGFPIPGVESLATEAYAQYRVLHTKMSEFAESKGGLITLASVPHCLPVLWTNRVGMVAAEELFGGSAAVILEESEQRYWFTEICDNRQEALWWYAFAWWTIREGLDRDDAERILGRYARSPDSSWWVVESGIQWGPLAGGCRQELWRWDGAQAEFIETCNDLTF
jgi:hypothetical protein